MTEGALHVSRPRPALGAARSRNHAVGARCGRRLARGDRARGARHRPDDGARVPRAPKAARRRRISSRASSTTTTSGPKPCAPSGRGSRRASRSSCRASALDVVAFGCTSATMTLGEDAVFAEIRKARPEVACTTPVTAALAAFRALGARSIGLLTPYAPEINASLVAYFRGRGVGVAAVATFDRRDDRDAARISVDSIEEATRASPPRPESRRSSSPAPACASPRRRRSSSASPASRSPPATTRWRGIACAFPASATRCRTREGCSNCRWRSEISPPGSQFGRVRCPAPSHLHDLPVAIVTRRSMRAARSMSWVAMSAARPVALTSAARVPNTWSAVFGSRLPVGSSASSTRGPLATARAMATRCRSPPESSAGRWPSRALRPR